MQVHFPTSLHLRVPQACQRLFSRQQSSGIRRRPNGCARLCYAVWRQRALNCQKVNPLISAAPMTVPVLQMVESAIDAHSRTWDEPNTKTDAR